MITTTMFDLPGYRIVKMLGCVYGITVRSRNLAAGLGMMVKSIAGGELKWFTNLVRFLPPAYLNHSVQRVLTLFCEFSSTRRATTPSAGSSARRSNAGATP